MNTTVRTQATLKDWVGSTHPVPSFVVATLTTVFAWSVGLAWWHTVAVFVAMLANQTGIGLGNDWLDASQDKSVGRSDKPIASGIIPPITARNTAVALGIVALGVSATLSLWAVVCQGLMLGAGWWYNVHAKNHWTSVVAYLLGFSLLPVFPLLAATPPHLPAGWIIAVAGLLGVSAHFANALPDLADDARLGIAGLPQRVGARGSGVALSIGVIAATSLITVMGDNLPPWLRITTAVLAVFGALLATFLAFRPQPPRIIFPLVMVSAAISVVAIAWELRG